MVKESTKWSCSCSRSFSRVTAYHPISDGESLTSQLVEDSGDSISTASTGHVHRELVLLQEREMMSHTLSGVDREQRMDTISLKACEPSLVRG